MPFRILVLCTGNSARSQIAEALLSARGTPRIAAASAGSRPASAVHPEAVAVLRRHGIEWSARRPKGIEEVAGERFDLLITVCDAAAEDCPFFPGAGARAHWSLADPAEEVDAEAARVAFERTYSLLSRHIESLLALPLESMSSAELERAVAAIHQPSSPKT